MNNMGFVIEKITAFVAIDPNDGNEGIISLPIPGGTELTIPAIAADPARAESLYPIIKHYCDAMNVEFKVVQFSTRTDVSEKWEKEIIK
jgi:hypothetical protein